VWCTSNINFVTTANLGRQDKLKIGQVWEERNIYRMLIKVHCMQVRDKLTSLSYVVRIKQFWFRSVFSVGF